MKSVFPVELCILGHHMPEKVAMAITASTHNQTEPRNPGLPGCATVTCLLDRWTLTGNSPCRRICVCTGDGRSNR